MTARYPKKHTSILTQLRTQHIPLRAYLHRFKLEESPTCQQCGEEPETTTHFLFFCTKFEGQRNKLKQELKRGRELDASILGEKKSIPAVFRYIEATKCFEDSHGSFSPHGN
ncbi:hypothetical protein BYT27DRAFT_7079142 [Phlegmacium glaucopus]|nr:hypothetical protein BYT27DRAFT_7079142 [Phlegmacium glaucopus]